MPAVLSAAALALKEARKSLRRTYSLTSSPQPKPTNTPTTGIRNIASRRGEDPGMVTVVNVRFRRGGRYRPHVRTGAGDSFNARQPTVTTVKAATPTTINTTPASCNRVNRSRRNT
jgi:hypothetical protein